MRSTVGGRSWQGQVRGVCFDRASARLTSDQSASALRHAGALQPRHDAMAYRVLSYAPAPILTLPDGFTRPKRRPR
jgi:hypothetical protein